jgi:hypothetical protein
VSQNCDFSWAKEYSTGSSGVGDCSTDHAEILDFRRGHTEQSAELLAVLARRQQRGST